MEFIKVALPDMTEQEIFDIVVEHLLTQRHWSMSMSGGCLYRGPNGRKCAAGALIPDDQYDERMEGHISSSVFRVVSESMRALISSLQEVHDYPVPEAWAERLLDVAERYSLNHSLVERLA